MIDVLTGLFHQYTDQFMTWHYAAGNLTQYSVIIASGMAFFLITPMPGAGTTEDENGVVAIKGESR